jgi:hypothetical protein
MSALPLKEIHGGRHALRLPKGVVIVAILWKLAESVRMKA